MIRRTFAVRATALSILLTFAPLAIAAGDGSTDQVLPVYAGDSVPFDGLLVPEHRFTLFLKAEADVRDFRVRLDIQTKYSLLTEQVYQRALSEARPWYREPWFVGTFFFLLGAGLAALAVYVGAQVVKANK